MLSIKSLEIPRGEIFCYLGSNGAGKTTTIHLLTGIQKPDSGDIILNNQSLINHPYKERDRDLTYIPDVPILYDELTGWEQLEFYRQIYGLTSEVFFERLNKLIDLFDFRKELDADISSYSKGMKQKLQIIASFIKETSLYVLDEPFSGLDIDGIESLKYLLKKKAESGSIVFISTHLLDVMLEIGTSGLYIKNGKIEQICYQKKDLYKLKKNMEKNSIHL